MFELTYEQSMLQDGNPLAASLESSSRIIAISRHYPLDYSSQINIAGIIIIALDPNGRILSCDINIPRSVNIVPKRYGKSVYNNYFDIKLGAKNYFADEELAALEFQSRIGEILVTIGGDTSNLTEIALGPNVSAIVDGKHFRGLRTVV